MSNEDGLPVLETLCSECQGEGGLQGYGGWEACGPCDGAGYVATEFGQRILDLVEHHRQARKRDKERRRRLRDG